MPLNNASNPEVIAKSAAVADAFTPEMYNYLLSLLPTPQSYRENHDRLTTTYSASLSGDEEKAKECEAHRKALSQEYAILSALARIVSVKDPEAPAKLGLPSTPEKTAHVISTLSDPQNFKILYNPKGELIASTTRVLNAKGYEVWACEGDPSLEANWRLVAASPMCRGIVVPGLNRAKSNWLRIRARRGNTAGPWSNYVCLSPS